MHAVGQPADDMVAPFTGAWIEIKVGEIPGVAENVAPFTGAWIEINFLVQRSLCEVGRTLHGCVD